MENFFQTQKTNFKHGKRTLKVQKCQILTASCYLYLKNIKILLKYNIFIPKILSYFGWHTFEFKSQNCSILHVAVYKIQLTLLLFERITYLVSFHYCKKNPPIEGEAMNLRRAYRKCH